jgi:hypothetical protein
MSHLHICDVPEFGESTDEHTRNISKFGKSTNKRTCDISEFGKPTNKRTRNICMFGECREYVLAKVHTSKYGKICCFMHKNIFCMYKMV